MKPTRRERKKTRPARRSSLSQLKIRQKKMMMTAADSEDEADLDLYSAKLFGQKHGKWIALLINDESFESFCFNRDIFNTDLKQKANTLIKKNFVFLRKSSSSDKSIKILQNYKITEQSIPVFLIIDSSTGELKKNFGNTKDLTLRNVVRELKKYTSTEDKELKYSSEETEDSDDDNYYVPLFSGCTNFNAEVRYKANSTAFIKKLLKKFTSLSNYKTSENVPTENIDSQNYDDELVACYVNRDMIAIDVLMYLSFLRPYNMENSEEYLRLLQLIVDDFSTKSVSTLNFMLHYLSFIIPKERIENSKLILLDRLIKLDSNLALMLKNENTRAAVVNYINEQKRTNDKDLAKQWTYMERCYNEGHWTVLPMTLKSVMNNPKNQNEKALMELYSNFISTFETEIYPIDLVEIVTVIISHISNKKDAITFIDKLKEKVERCNNSVRMCQVLQGQIYLEFLADMEATKKIIEDLKDILENSQYSRVHGKYYMLASQYYRHIKQHADYYRCSLQFLGCSIKSEWPDQAFFIGLAALLGEGVYDISELLNHPIIESLRGTDKEWLIKLLHAFNSGDIEKFEQMKPIWRQINELKEQEVKLRQKIKIIKENANNQTR